MGPERRLALTLAVVVPLGGLFGLAIAAGAPFEHSTQTPFDRQADASSDGTDSFNATLVGDGVALRGDNLTYLWQDGNHSVRVTVSVEHNESMLCLRQRLPGDPPHRNNCFRFSSQSGRTPFEVARNNTTRRQLLEVTLDTDERSVTRTLPFQVVNRSGDLDDDGLSNQREVAVGSGINDTDSDEDGLMDGTEVMDYGTDPALADTDGDGVRDGVEISRGTNATLADTDGDGLTDGEEIDEYGTDPLEPDTDGDGLTDAEEVQFGTDPTTADTDADGLTDAEEIDRYGTDPLERDTDGDRLRDGEEVDVGSDPTSAFSPFGYVLVPLLLVGAAIVGRRYYKDGEWSPIADTVETIRYGEPADESGVSTPLGGGDVDAEDSSDEEYMTPESFVHRLLEQNENRMKQSEIVESTDWSKAKVSRVLGRMENEGEIHRYKVGRENVVTLESPESISE